MRKALWRDDSGVALITVMLLVLVAVVLSAVVFQLALHNQDSSSLNRKRVQSIATAEAGIDLTLARLSTVPSPCTGDAELTGQSHTSPAVSTYTVTIDYYATYPTSGSPLQCTAGSGPTSTPAAAVISAVGTSHGGPRKMQSLVRLNPIPVADPGFNRAIFSSRQMSVSNSPNIYGFNGNDADIYTNGDFSCSNSQTYYGSVVAQGTATMANSCSVRQDLYVADNVTTSGHNDIGHDLKTSGGNISLNKNTTVGHDAIAAGTNSGGTVANTRVSNATLAAPPRRDLPQVNFSASAWQAAGYTSQITNNNCTTGSGGVYEEISNMSSATAPTVIQTSCALSWANNTTITLNNNLAIFSTGGFSAVNNFTVKSSGSTRRDLYLIVPFAAATQPCTTPGITLSNRTTFNNTTNPIRVMMYTPCSITVSNKSSFSGQIYADNVTYGNNFDMYYSPMNIAGTVFPPVSGGTPAGFSIDTIYKRETT